MLLITNCSKSALTSVVLAASVSRSALTPVVLEASVSSSALTFVVLEDSVSRSASTVDIFPVSADVLMASDSMAMFCPETDSVIVSYCDVNVF